MDEGGTGMTTNKRSKKTVKPKGGRGVILVWYTVQEAAGILKVHPDTLIRGMDAGDIPFKTVGQKSRRIPASWVHSTDQLRSGDA